MKERRHTWHMLAAQQSDEDGSFVFGQRSWDRSRMLDVDARITRSEYWASLALTLPVLLITVVVESLLVYVGAQIWIVNAVFIGGMLLTLWILLNASALRAHDRGISGAWLWLWLQPVLGIVLTIVLGSTRSQPGRNEWGLPVSKARY